MTHLVKEMLMCLAAKKEDVLNNRKDVFLDRRISQLLQQINSVQVYMCVMTFYHIQERIADNGGIPMLNRALLILEKGEDVQ